MNITNKNKLMHKLIKVNKKSANDSLTIKDFLIFFKVITNRFVAAVIIMCMLTLIDHPSQIVIKFLHELLVRIAIP